MWGILKERVAKDIKTSEKIIESKRADKIRKETRKLNNLSKKYEEKKIKRNIRQINKEYSEKIKSNYIQSIKRNFNNFKPRELKKIIYHVRNEARAVIKNNGYYKEKILGPYEYKQKN